MFLNAKNKNTIKIDSVNNHMLNQTLAINMLENSILCSQKVTWNHKNVSV